MRAVWKAGLLVALLVSSPALLNAQAPVGLEFRVDTSGGAGFSPVLAALPAGDFLVVWVSSAEPPGSQEIRAQRFDGGGGRRGAEFRVNSTTGSPYNPSVAMAPSGAFVVAWNALPDIRGRRFVAAGAPLGADFVVASLTTNYEELKEASIAVDGQGRFVVSWVRHQGIDDYDVFARRYDAAGVPQGAALLVDRVLTPQSTQLLSARVAAAAGGDFVVVWRRQGALGADVLARRYDAAGSALGGPFTVNSDTNSVQGAPSVSANAAGDFVVTWVGGYGRVLARRFAADGMPRGNDSEVTSAPFARGATPGLGPTGEFMVAWTADDEDYRGVFARRVDASGVPLGAELRLNTYTTGSQDGSVVAAAGQGRFVLAWSSSEGSAGAGVYARRFGGLVGTALAVDAAGNGVWEPGESVEVRPTWGNFGATTQALDGQLTELEGPAGATYTIVDGNAVYGPVAPGATATCSSCYTVAVSAAAPRPVSHWDATALETVAAGTSQRWRLHVGGSFADVPPSQPFFRFVETLLHQGVTAGCGGLDYCPLAVTTREQMSVFVLLGKGGAGYVPPPCLQPPFSDVPLTSPFCRYIKELAGRGVVNGCGSGDFCPKAPVTRDQMSVFVLRTLDPALDPPACTTPAFSDVPASSPYCRWIEELLRRGVVAGCGDGRYCPLSPVSRDQMAVFIGVTFGLTLYGP